MFANKTPHPYFFEKEFVKADLNIQDLADDLHKSFSKLDIEGEGLNYLNHLLQSAEFFEASYQKHQSQLSSDIQNKCSKLNDILGRSGELSDKHQHLLARVNRLIIEDVYLQSPKRPKWKDDLIELVDDLLIACALALVFRAFIFQPYKIPSGSMRKTLVEGDHLFVNKLRLGPRFIPVLRVPNFDHTKTPIYADLTDKLPTIKLPGFGKLERGDVIIFVAPHDKGKDFIKRLIAFGGETVEIKDGDVYVDGQMVQLPEIKNVYYTNAGRYGREGYKVTVPENHYFVLGDNSRNSQDSRFWGFVPDDYIIGRAEVIFLPLNRIRFIK